MGRESRRQRNTAKLEYRSKWQTDAERWGTTVLLGRDTGLWASAEHAIELERVRNFKEGKGEKDKERNRECVQEESERERESVCVCACVCVCECVSVCVRYMSGAI